MLRCSVRWILLFIWLFAFELFVVTVVADRAICYSGSNLYQRITQDCTNKDSSYNGDWYCSKVEICERFISDNRECSIVRSCATEEECTDENGDIYDGTELDTENLDDNINFGLAGMKITITCCKAEKFADDDAVAIDFADVCNAAGRGGNMPVMGLAVSVTLLVSFLLSWTSGYSDIL